MTSRPSIPFPLTLEAFADGELIEALTTLELGAMLRLLRACWRQDPPCRLRDDDASLAMVARVTHQEWAAAKPRLLLALEARQDTAGWLQLDAAARVYEDLRKLSAKRAGAARARWVPPDASAMHLHSTCSASASAAPSERSSEPGSRAPAPLRPLPSEGTQSAPEGAADIIGTVGAEARALVRERKEATWSKRLLSMAKFPDADDDRKVLPATLIASLSEQEHATPMRVAYAIEQAVALGAKWAAAPAGKRRPNPIAILIDALGAQREYPKAPWDVPLAFQGAWRKREIEHEKLQDLQRLIDTRSRPAQVARQSGVRA